MSTILTALALAAAGSGLLVTPAELAARLKDPSLVVLAVGVQPGDFETAHIPGARLIAYDQIAIDGPDGLGSELPTVDDLRALFAAAGVTAKSQIVIYGSPISATRAFFTLDDLGHDRSGRFAPDAELRAKMQAAGAVEGTPVVSYCMVGMRASVTYFVARHLGYDAKLYDGSIVDWGRRKLPTKTGR